MMVVGFTVQSGVLSRAAAPARSWIARQCTQRGSRPDASRRAQLRAEYLAPEFERPLKGDKWAGWLFFCIGCVFAAADKPRSAD
jgi:hypothetical protein